jgi:phosphate starvation-inducible PhoH-like protein
MRSKTTKSSRSKNQNQEEAQVAYFKASDIKIELFPIQKPVLNFIRKNEISVITSDPGCGKTTLALYYAIQGVLNGEYDEIIITKPIVECGASIGYLPGEVADKIAPYKQSYIDVIVELVGKIKAADLLKNRIRFETIAFVQGKTFKGACIIYDEFQNSELFEIMNVVSRTHDSSRIILLGDELQSSIRRSGLRAFVDHILINVKGAGHLQLGEEHQTRSLLVQQLWNNYKKFLMSK